jgi:hypothetical protein
MAVGMMLDKPGVDAYWNRMLGPKGTCRALYFLVMNAFSYIMYYGHERKRPSMIASACNPSFLEGSRPAWAKKLARPHLNNILVQGHAPVTPAMRAVWVGKSWSEAGPSQKHETLLKK